MRLRWWSRGPSARSWLLLAVAAAPLVWLGAAGVPAWVLLVSSVVSGAAASGVFVRAESGWRRRCALLPATHRLQQHVDAVSGRFGLWRRPVVLFSPTMRSPAAAVDTAHPGSTLLVTGQLADWDRSGGGQVVRAVLAHEFAHLHRFHSLVGLAHRAAAVAGASAVSVVAVWQLAASWLAWWPDGWTPPLVWRWLPVVAVAVWVAVPLLVVAQRHVCELDADRDAATVGFGRELAWLFEQGEEGDEPPLGRLRSWW